MIFQSWPLSHSFTGTLSTYYAGTQVSHWRDGMYSRPKTKIAQIINTEGEHFLFIGFLLLVMLFIFLAPLHANSPLMRPTMDAVRTTKSPEIDGVLDDGIWHSAQGYTDFQTFNPDVGSPISEKTTAYIAYDENNLYFAFDCKDSQPHEIKASHTKRDGAFGEDQVAVFLDPHNDFQSAYVFFVNPYGVQGDLMMNSQGSGDPRSADFIWESAGRLVDDGYQVEYKIPLESIRFKGGNLVSMGIGLYRTISRTSEQTLFPSYEPDRGSLLSQSGLVHYQNLQSKQVIEVLPSVTASQQSEHQNGTMKQVMNEQSFGATGKIGITPTLTLDMTYNPDFSQVEADAKQIAEVNTRYAIYYPETRPFFLEGQDNFDFAGLAFSAPISRVVHTRTIVDPRFGIKLSGKLGQKNNIASIFSVDDFPKDETGHAANVGILRYKRLGSDDSYLGGLVTSRNLGSLNNSVFGLDAKKWINGSLRVEGNVLGTSSTAEDGDQRGLSGSSFWIYEKKTFQMGGGLHHISRDFELQPGFLRRTGTTTLSFDIMKKDFSTDKNAPQYMQWLNKHTPVQALRTGMYFRIINDHKYNMNEGLANLYMNFNLPRSSSIGFNAMKANEIFVGRSFETSSVTTYCSSQPRPWLSFYAQAGYGGHIYYDEDNPYQGNQFNMYAGTTLRPTNDLNLSLNYSRSIFHRESDGEEIYDFKLYRGRLTYQINRYLYVRGIVEYDDLNRVISSDLLAGFTYIPGTVVYVGYGARHERRKYMEPEYVEANRYMMMRNGFFVKASYNWIF